jgi:hypothetical protein
VFTVGWLLADRWQGPGYSTVRHTISDETALTAPHAWYLISCQLICGAGTIVFALFGLRPVLAGAGAVRRVAPWMLAVGGVSYLVVFPRIPCRLADTACSLHEHLYSAGGMTDALVSGIAVAVLAITPFPLWARMREIPRWRRLRPFMIAGRVLGPVLLIATVSQGPFAPGPYEGLLERALALTAAVWISALAIALITTPDPPAGQDQKRAREFGKYGYRAGVKPGPIGPFCCGRMKLARVGDALARQCRLPLEVIPRRERRAR